jgi:hypothetical protein
MRIGVPGGGSKDGQIGMTDAVLIAQGTVRLIDCPTITRR